MDRNYFLSCGHMINAAFLLIISAIGSLNARFISAAMAGPEKFLRHMDVSDDQQGSLGNSSVYNLSERMEAPANENFNAHHDRTNDGIPPDSYHTALQKHFPVIDNNGFFLSFLNNLKTALIADKWCMPLSTPNIRASIILSEKFRLFYTIPFRSVNGFKLIVKIPDKLI